MQDHKHLTLWCFLLHQKNVSPPIYSQSEHRAAILFPSRPVTATCFFFAKYKYFLIFVAFIIHPYSQRNMIITTINWRSARVCGFNKSDIIISYYFTLWKYQKCYCHSVKIWGKKTINSDVKSCTLKDPEISNQPLADEKMALG